MGKTGRAEETQREWTTLTWSFHRRRLTSQKTFSPDGGLSAALSPAEREATLSKGHMWLSEEWWWWWWGVTL